jgi:hypothetical protein
MDLPRLVRRCFFVARAELRFGNRGERARRRRNTPEKFRRIRINFFPILRNAASPVTR